MVATGDLVESVRSLAEQAGWLSELEELGTEEREEGRGVCMCVGWVGIVYLCALYVHVCMYVCTCVCVCVHVRAYV